MYSGTTFHSKSGHIIGVHQRIDRLARRNLNTVSHHAPDFPKIRQILHFEGNNGPDGIKRKSPSIDEPWHYIDPNNPKDRQLLVMIDDHMHNLTQALLRDNPERAAYEAAWLAHAITDGLTPAHHYPLSDKIEELWGHPKEERLTKLQKNLIRGKTHRESISKNWEYWGAKGVFSTHLLFELGVASSITTHRFYNSVPNEQEIAAVHEKGFDGLFLQLIDDVYQLGMYETFWKHGWTTSLAKQTRNVLMPSIIKGVTLAWYEALRQARDAA